MKSLIQIDRQRAMSSGSGASWIGAQSELAATRAKCGDYSTVAGFDRKRNDNDVSAKRQAVRRALEAAGVEFIDENGGGPGVRLRKAAKDKSRK